MTFDRPETGVAQRLLPAVVQSLVAFVLADDEENVLFLNAAAENLWGYRKEDLLGKSCRILLPLERQSSSLAAVAADESSRMSENMHICRKDGDTQCVDFFCSRGVLGGEGHYLIQAFAFSEKNALREENRLLRLIMNHAAHAVFIIDRQRRLLQANKAFTELFGYTLDEAMGKAPGELLSSPRTDISALERLRSLAWMQGGYKEEILAQDKYGRELWVNCSLNPIAGDNGEITNAVVVLEDVTERRLIRDLERDVLRALTSSTSFEDLGGYISRRVKEIAPDILPSLLRVDEQGRLRLWAATYLPDGYNAMVDGVQTGEGAGSCGTAVARGKPVVTEDIASDKLWRGVREAVLAYGLRACWSYPIKRPDGSVAGTFAFYSKQPGRPTAFHEYIIEASTHLCALAIEREESRLQISRLVQFDQLTGLPNRNHLARYIGEWIEQNPRQAMAVFSIGLDRFKDVNDALGHSAGDRALVQIAGRLLEHVNLNVFLGRTEGDLFVIVATHFDATEASRLAERLRAAIAAPMSIDQDRLSLGASVGISMCPESGSCCDALLEQAKKAMYQAKASGGGACRFFDYETHSEAKTRLFVGQELRRAIVESRLHLHYQPQVKAGDGTLYGVEALARWSDPELGSIPPGKFIGLAEEIGEIENLGRWALREACRQMAAWRGAGIGIPVVSVNLSPFSFRDRLLPDYVAGLLKEYGLSGVDLTIEITESAAMSLTPEKLEVVHALRALGVGLSVDDFGTGFSSLSNLVTLPVTEVKIDRSFIDRCLKEKQLRSLVASVIGIGQALQLAVVAEGVETEEQMALLALHRCPVMQGYLFSRPLPPADIPAWLSHHSPEKRGEMR